MKSEKIIPGARRLIDSLRNMGYDCNTAIADLVDNSVTADASEIYIDILDKSGSQPAAIIIADNGKGMDRDELLEAMRFGAYQDYSESDLGKYGLGLKTASLSQCRILTVSSKPKSASDTRSRRNFVRWDIDHVYKVNDWYLLTPSESDFEDYERNFLSHEVARKNGTVVMWTNLDGGLQSLSEQDAHNREIFLAKLIKDVSDHLRMVFHRFMQGSIKGRCKLNIYVCGEKLKPWDPFCRDEKTKELDIIKLPISFTDTAGLKIKDNVIISPFVLPREDEFSSHLAWSDASGPKKWNQQQGFYFYRNNRLLRSGGWSGLRSVDEHTKLLRIGIDFSSYLDWAFAINITKMRAKIPHEIRGHIETAVTEWIKEARRRYDNNPSIGRSRGARSESGTVATGINPPFDVHNIKVGPVVFLRIDEAGHSLKVRKDRKNDQIQIYVPRDHGIAPIFTLSNNSDGELKKLLMALMGILEALHEKKIKISDLPMTALKKIFKNHS